MAVLGETIEDVISQVNNLRSLVENIDVPPNIEVESVLCSGIITTADMQTQSITIFDNLTIGEIAFEQNIISLSTTSSYNQLIIRADNILFDSEGTSQSINTSTINTENITPWAGLRPMTPNMMPIVKQSTNNKRVFYNTGHGHLGWTLGAFTAQKIVEQIGNNNA